LGLWSRDENNEPLEPPSLDSDFLKQAVEAMTNPVIVIDTFATFHNGDENDNAVVGRTCRNLRYLTNLGATVLVIHHTGKNPTSKYRGASAMEGAVDLGLKIVGTTDDEGLLTKIEVQTFKTRIGNGKPIVYKMENGIPVRVTATSADRLMDFLQRNAGLTKEKFEDMARKAGFRRSVVRSFVERGIVGGTVSYEKRKLSVKTKHVRQ
jgi:hypothetical protein